MYSYFIKFTILAIISGLVLMLFPNYAQASPGHEGTWIVHLKGCERDKTTGVPLDYKGQTIMLQKQDTSNGKWVTTKTFTTGDSGTVSFTTSDLPSSYHLLRVLFKKSRWVYDYGYINNTFWDIYLDVYQDAVPDLQGRLVGQSYSEKTWSESRDDYYFTIANGMKREELLTALHNLANTYDHDAYIELTKLVDSYNLKELRNIYASYNAEMDAVKRYVGSTTYVPWCTAFTTYIIRKAGGPTITTQSAVVFYNFFSAGGTVVGKDGLKYVKSGLNHTSLMKLINNSSETAILRPGDFYLEKFIGDPRYTGHSAVILEPIYSKNNPEISLHTMEGNHGPIVTEGTRAIDMDRSPSNRPGISIDLKAGRFRCVN